MEIVKQKPKYSFKESITAYAFLLPALILAFTFVILPIFSAFINGFTDYYLLKPDEKTFIGIDNFVRMTSDTLLLKTFKNTVYFVVLVVPLQLGMALVLALIVNKKLKFNGYFRMAYFAPAVLSLVVISILWSVLLNPSSGLANELLTMIGIPR